MRKAAGTLLGKVIARAVKVRGRSGGQAMPGLVVETLMPGYLGMMLEQLPQGVVVITGTNGKTTTTKMVVEVLRKHELRVLTNPTGSNLTRGIIGSVSQQATRKGKLPFDIAVFELDEAYARQFTDVIKPRFVLGLNASRDQLDRFGEVDTVARLIAETMLSATDAIIVNANDQRLSDAVQQTDVSVHYFGVATNLLQHFPRDDELVAVSGKEGSIRVTKLPLDVELRSFMGEQATYRVGGQDLTAELHVTGQHNFQNAAGALALLGVILPDAATEDLLGDLAKVQPAFGRGQVYRLKSGAKLQLNLVKNPASFRQGLASYANESAATMIVINDRVADSRDMSWLWDIDFTTLTQKGVALTSGSRAVDMALRLQYDEVGVGAIEPDIERALTMFARLPGNKVIFASYTAMLRLHALLEKTAGKDI